MTDIADIVLRVDSTQLVNAKKETENLRQSTVNLLASVDRVAAAQISHAKALDTLVKAEKAGIITQDEVKKTTDALTQRLEAQGMTLNNLGQVVERNTGIFRKFGSSGMQQVGYQVGDFAVQVQGGTSAVVALGQQGAQLLGIFGAGGAIAGAFLAIGTAIYHAYSATESLSDATKDLDKDMTALHSDLKLLKSGAEGITEEFGKITTGLEDTIKLSAMINLAKVMKDAKTELQSFTGGMYTSEQPIMKSTVLSQTFESARGFEKNFGVNQAQADLLAENELALARAKTEKERLSILNQMTPVLEKQLANGVAFTDSGYEYAQQLLLIQQHTQEAVNLQDQLNGYLKSGNEEKKKADLDAIAYAQTLLDSSKEEMRIQEATLQYGKDSKEVAIVRAQVAAEAVRLKLDEKFATDGVSQAEQKIIDAAADAAYQHEINDGLLRSQAANARELGAGLRESVSAMASLAGFSTSLDKALAESVAKVSALKSKADATVAGQIAGYRFELQDKIEKAIATGISGAVIEKMYGGARDKINQLEASMTEESTIKAENAAANKHGPKGVSEATVENKLKGLYEYLGETKKVNAYLIEEENIAYDQREDLLKSALDKKLITLQEYQQMELDLTTMHQDALNKIESARQNQRLGDTATFFGGLADVAKAGGDKTVKAMRIFSAAQALINSYVAFTEVLKDPSLIGRPWARFGMAASALASGLSAVTAIKSGGGSVKGISSGGGSVGTSPASAESASPTTVMIQGMKPTDIFTGEQLSTLFDSLYKENNNRGMVFMVQR